MTSTTRVCASGLVVMALSVSGCVSAGSTTEMAVSCRIQGISLGTPDGLLALPGTYRLDGLASVECQSHASREQLVELALMSDSSDPVLLNTSVRERSHGLAYEVFSDVDLLHPLPVNQAAAAAGFQDVRLSSNARMVVNIPFYGRVRVPAVMPPGAYTAPSGLSVYFRSKP